jgi:hypothetical protein
MFPTLGESCLILKLMNHIKQMIQTKAAAFVAAFV